MDSNNGGLVSGGSGKSGTGQFLGQRNGAGSVGSPGLGSSAGSTGMTESAGVTGAGISAEEQARLQRQTATGIARKKVLAAYDKAQQKEIRKQQAKNGGVNGGQGGTGVNAGMMNAGRDNATRGGVGQAGGHLKNQPTISKANSEEWRKYHSAWQNYYQKYYSEYYASAARNYVERERLKDARKRAEDEDTLEAIGKIGKIGKFGRKKSQEGAYGAPQTSVSEADNVGEKLRENIRKKAVKNVKKARRRRHWVPVILGVAVVLIILFMQYNRLIFAPIFAYVSPGNAPASKIEAIDPTLTQKVSAEPRLIIPKLNIDVPITFGLQLNDVMDAMNHGVAHYRIAGASAYPGEIGNTVITGHSAGDIYSSNQYKYIFSGLDRLEEGDLIYLNYESTRYTYQVTKKEVIEPTNVAALVVDTDKPILTLVTCTPLGTSRYRLLVFADQISPSVEGATESKDTVVDVDEDESLPSNEPSFFEGIWNFMTGK